MILILRELAQKFGVNGTFVTVAVAGVLTAVVLLIPAITQWSDDWKS
jgi:hypothetical protein